MRNLDLERGNLASGRANLASESEYLATALNLNISLSEVSPRRVWPQRIWPPSHGIPAICLDPRFKVILTNGQIASAFVHLGINLV